jgi:hypothetical protein
VPDEGTAETPSTPAEQPARGAEKPAAEPPPEAAIRAALDPVYAEVKSCLGRTPVVLDAGVHALMLRIGVHNGGSVRGVDLEGWPPARECVGNALQKLKFPSWQGNPIVITLPLSVAGAALPFDAAAPPAPADGGGSTR